MVALSGPITNNGTSNSILYSSGAGVPVTASPGGAIGRCCDGEWQRNANECQ